MRLIEGASDIRNILVTLGARHAGAIANINLNPLTQRIAYHPRQPTPETPQEASPPFRTMPVPISIDGVTGDRVTRIDGLPTPHDGYPITIFTPKEAELTPAQHEVYKEIGKLIGGEYANINPQELREKIRARIGPGLLFLFQRAGWGHAHASFAIMQQMLRHVRLPVIGAAMDGVAERVDPLSVLPAKLKEAAHAAVQRGADVRMAVHDTLREHGVAGDIGARLMAETMAAMFQWGGLGKSSDADGDVYHAELVLWQLMQFPDVYAKILQGFTHLNHVIYNTPVASSLKQALDGLGAQYGYASLPSPAIFLPHVLSHILDRGYGRELWIAIDKITQACHDLRINPPNLLEFVGGKDQTILAPDPVTKAILAQFFGRPDNVFDVGDHFGPIETEHVLDKWQDTTHDRRILAATGGNGTNIPELCEVVRNFREYKEKKNDDNPYTCFVFVGDHIEKDNQVQDLVAEVKNGGEGTYVELIYRPGDDLEAFWQGVIETQHKGKVVLVGCEDLFSVAAIKARLQEYAHAEIGKTGEAQVLNPHKGTVTVALKPAPPNEQVNGMHALLCGGAIALAPEWAEYAIRYCEQLYKDIPDKEDRNQKILERVRSIPGLEHLIVVSAKNGQPRVAPLREPNVFDMFDRYFGDTQERRESGTNRMLQIAMEGFVNMQNATLPTMALMIARVLGVDPAQITEEMQVRIEEYHLTKQDEKRQLVQETFGGKIDVDTFRDRFEEEIPVLESAISIPDIGIVIRAIINVVMATRERVGRGD